MSANGVIWPVVRAGPESLASHHGRVFMHAHSWHRPTCSKYLRALEVARKLTNASHFLQAPTTGTTATCATRPINTCPRVSSRLPSRRMRSRRALSRPVESRCSVSGVCLFEGCVPWSCREERRWCNRLVTDTRSISLCHLALCILRRVCVAERSPPKHVCPTLRLECRCGGGLPLLLRLCA